MMIKWKAKIINGYYWLGIKFPNGHWIRLQRKNRVGDVQHF